jgi:hypothetical protein
VGGSEHAALVAVVDEIVEETMTLPGTTTPQLKPKVGTGS